MPRLIIPSLVPKTPYGPRQPNISKFCPPQHITTVPQQQHPKRLNHSTPFTRSHNSLHYVPLKKKNGPGGINELTFFVKNATEKTQIFTRSARSISILGSASFSKNGPGGIRTHGHLVKSQMLCLTELRAHSFLKKEAPEGGFASRCLAF